MKRIALKVASGAFLIGAAVVLANGQAEITVDGVFTVSSKAFTVTPVEPFEKGQPVGGNLVIGHGATRFWSDHEHDFVIGGRTVKYPILGIWDCSDADYAGSCGVVASILVIEVDMRAGEAMHSDGYVIVAKRAFKAGESIPTLLLLWGGADSIISIEATPMTKNKGDAAKPEPLLTIFNEHLKPSGRAFAVEAWRITNEYASSPRMATFR